MADAKIHFWDSFVIGLTTRELRHAQRIVRVPAGEHSIVPIDLKDMIIYDIWVHETEQMRPVTGNAYVALVLGGGKSFVSRYARNLPPRSFKRRKDWYVNEDGEKVLKTNLSIPVHIHKDEEVSFEVLDAQRDLIIDVHGVSE